MNHYIYIYLDPRKPGNFKYDDLEFKFEPFYLGVSKNETRKFDHLNGAKKYIKDGIANPRYRNNKKIYKIAKIINDGYDPIIFEYKSGLEESEAYKLEEELVTKIGRTRINSGPLLNYLPGGQIIDGDLISIQLRKNIGLNKHLTRKVKQFGLDGKLLKIWNSVIEAKRITGATHLDGCCRGLRKTSGGFIWKYENETPPINTPKKYKSRKTNNIQNKREIEQFDLLNNKISEYKSVTEAANVTGVSRKSIGNVLAKKTKTAGKYIWKYKIK